MRAGVFAAIWLGCSHPAATALLPSSTLEAAAPVEAASGESGETAAAVVDAGHGGAIDPAPPPHSAPTMTVSQAADVLFLPNEARPPCGSGDDVAQVACSIAERYASDERAAHIAQELFTRTGDVAGILAPETMEGGWRGTLHLVPALPVMADRKHLEWVAEATRDYDSFFEALTGGREGAPKYVWRGLAFHFMRSVAARTPSAYASGWNIAYNLAGSLNTSADAVRELLFHEIFHSNDLDHGDWAVRALGPTFDSIVGRCGSKIACLTPFTPTEMTVRGGTYYSFQPNNGAAVREYAAELALRYYREQRAVLRGAPVTKRFKCGPKENGGAWRMLVEEFFGGIDRTGGC